MGVSVRSRSSKEIEPLSLRVVPSVMSPETSVAVRVGTSLVPLMVISMSWEEVPPLPSSTVMVKVAVITSPAARKLRVSSGDGVIPVDGPVVGVVVCGCDGEAGLECGLLSGVSQRQRCGAIGEECGDGFGDFCCCGCIGEIGDSKEIEPPSLRVVPSVMSPEISID